MQTATLATPELNNEVAATRSACRGVLLPVLICLSLNTALGVGIAVNRPEYLRDYRLNANPDATDYVLLGRNVFLQGAYSRRSSPPYVPDIIRTPVYPLFAGGLDLVGGPWLLYAAQALLQAGSCLLLFVLVRPLFGVRAAFWASLLLACDLMLAVANFEAMSEPLFLFLMLAASACVLPIVSGNEGRMRSRLLAGGLLLGLTILTRPAALYLPAIYALGLFGWGLSRRRLGEAMRQPAWLLTATALVVAPWVVRNEVVFSVPRVTPLDASSTVYFLGSSGYQLRHGVSLSEAQAMIAEEFHLPPYVATQNPWIADRSVAEMDAELRNARMKVLVRYPGDLVKAEILGVAKASVSHNVGGLAYLLGREWAAPRAGALLSGDAEAVERLGQNGPVLAAAFLWESAHAVLCLLLAGMGVAVAVRHWKAHPVSLLLLAALLYFFVTVGMFGLEAYSRCRIPVLPFLYVFAGVGMVAVILRKPKAAPHHG